ncbi:MAG: aspartate 1-decarboxylase [Planctomycetes bacterium]|nr:aspartate 1-decarboxylase [Planctomycetota bacterium]
MRLRLLKSKIHRATVTGADLDYEGSITIDQDLMDATGLMPYEKVLVVDLQNGNRLETYTVSGEPGKGEICIMGAAAHLVKTGDLVIIMAFTDLEPEELADFKPKIVMVDKNNRLIKQYP